MGLDCCQLKRQPIRPSKRFFITDDTIAADITVMAAHTMVMDIGPTTVTATAIGHMVIMAAGDPASVFMSDLAGVGVVGDTKHASKKGTTTIATSRS